MNAKTPTRKAEIEHAREVDTEVARLWSLFHNINDRVAPLQKRIRSYASIRSMTPEMRAERVAKLEAQIEDIRAEAAPFKEAAIAYDKANYEGWSRFFYVVHIHKSMSCSSFRPTTRVGWLPNVSGLTEAEAVAEHGETLCTICFPDAPTELTTKTADPNVCAGTGKYSSDRRRYVTCPDCGQTVNRITGSGKIRKHKKP